MQETILFGWKQIAGFLGVNVKTAKRYAQIGMPVSIKLIGRPVATRDLIKTWFENQITNEHIPKPT